MIDEFGKARVYTHALRIEIVGLTVRLSLRYMNKKFKFYILKKKTIYTVFELLKGTRTLLAKNNYSKKITKKRLLGL